MANAQLRPSVSSLSLGILFSVSEVQQRESQNRFPLFAKLTKNVKKERPPGGVKFSRLEIILDSSMTTAAEKYPDFFKVFLPEQSSERMLIPNAWVKLTHLQGKIPKNVILRNGRRRVWHVKTLLIGDKLYFDYGWKVFQEENCIGKDDFLVFKYDGSKEFKVLTLELSTKCEKTVVENAEEQAAAQEVEEQEKEEHEQVEDCEIEDKEDSENEDYDNDDRDNDSDDNSDEYREMEEEIEEEYRDGNISPSFLRACKKDTASSSTLNAEDLLEEDDEFDPDMYIQPGNPYFEAKRYQARRNELHIPKNVTKKFSLTFPKKITLLCCQCCHRQDIPRNELQDYHLRLAQQTPIREKNLEVRGKVCRWLDDRLCIRGWLSFCTMNKIEKNDACLCEIILGEDQIARMLRVHLVSAKRG